MSLQVEKLEHNMAKLTIEVSAEEVEKALQAAYLKERSKISLPGFRKGKVPRQMIEKMYGPEVFYDEAANRMISEAYAKHMMRVNLRLLPSRQLISFSLRRENHSSSQQKLQLNRKLNLESTKDLKLTNTLQE